jgi:hypothetical protein
MCKDSYTLIHASQFSKGGFDNSFGRWDGGALLEVGLQVFVSVTGLHIAGTRRVDSFQDEWRLTYHRSCDKPRTHGQDINLQPSLDDVGW